MINLAWEKEFGEKDFILAGLHGDLAFKKNVEVLIYNFVMGQNCIPIVEICFFFIHISL